MMPQSRFARHVRDPKDEQTALWKRTADDIRDGVLGVVSALAKGKQPGEAARKFASEVTQTMAVADLLGRRRLLLEHDAARDRVPFELREQIAFASVPSSFPEVPFEEAIRDLVSREPRLARSAAEVARLYQSEHAFALSNSLELGVTFRAQQIVERIAAGEATRIAARNLIAQAGDFAKAYADVVYRTNLNTAYTAGRFAQARDPDVSEVIGALQRWEILDSDVRRGRPEDNGENHAAVHGLIASQRDPIWEFVSPPSGYNCRGGVRMMSKADLKARDLLGPGGEVRRFLPPDFASFRPHPNFRRSAFARVYGGSGILA